MTQYEAEIRDGILQMVRNAHIGAGKEAFSAEVTDVDIDTRSCTVLSISGQVETEYTNVWLMPQVCDGIMYVPKIGSVVIVENNANLQPFVVMWSEIVQVIFVVNNTIFSVTDGLTTFNAGDNAGLVNIKPLVDKINALENKVNDLVNAWGSFASAYVPGSPTFTGLPATVTNVSGNLPITKQADLEDTTVIH